MFYATKCGGPRLVGVTGCICFASAVLDDRKLAFAVPVIAPKSQKTCHRQLFLSAFCLLKVRILFIYTKKEPKKRTLFCMVGVTGYSAFRIFRSNLVACRKNCSFEIRQSNLLRILAVSTKRFAFLILF